MVYDPFHKLVFAAVSQTNLLHENSSTDVQPVATIPMSGPWGLDIAPDGSRILVGSQTRYLYLVDPVSLQVVGQIPMVSNLFDGVAFPAPLRPVVLASGKVLVATGGSPPYEWDPVADVWSNPTPPNFAPGDSAIRRSADHQKVVVAAVNENTLAVFDSASDSYGPVQKITTTAAALNSNGSRIAVLGPSPSIPGGNQVDLFDSQFNVIATYQLDAEVMPSDLVFSRDDSLLYVQSGGSVVALRAADLSYAGAVPSAGNGGVDYPSDIDETGMIFSFSEGAGIRSTIFTDASTPCALGTNQPYNMSLTPPQGNISSPAPTTLNAGGGITAQSQVYFGAPPGSPQATPGTNLQVSPSTAVQVTPPAAQAAGAVNVTVTNPDGSVGIAADGYSYGSSILAATPNSGPATGGTSVKIYGYGLAFSMSQIQVTVGGKAATVTSAFAGPGVSPFLFPMDQVTFTTPAGIPGPADIVVTTPVGSATVANGFNYLQNVRTYPVSSTLAEIAYDQSRQRLYATDYKTNLVYVFDLSAQKYLTPITVGNSPLALAITPDFTRLVVSNAADGTISIVDLTGVSATRTVPVANLSNLPVQCGPAVPYAVATTSKNQAVIALQCPNITEGEYIVLDLGTFAIGCGASQGCAAMEAAYPQNLDLVLAISGTTDGSKLFFWNGIAIGLWDVNADAFTSQSSGNMTLTSPVVQTAAAADGTVFAQITGIGTMYFNIYGIENPSLYQFSLLQDTDYLLTAGFDTSALPSEKLHPSGALLYLPNVAGLSIYDVHRGHLVRRISLPTQIAPTFDAINVDQTGSQVFLISSTGLTVVSIADLPVSLGSIAPAQGAAAGGISVKLRGSGFQSGAQVFFGTSSAIVAFVDSSTLDVTTPSLPIGSVRVVVVNPDGSQYSLDDAFTAN